MNLPDSILERATCKIGKSKKGGTGIIVAPNKILTCDHVIEELGDIIEISFPFIKNPISISIGKNSIQRFPRPIDLALIDFSEHRVEDYEIVIFDEIRLEEETKVKSLGFSNLNPEKDYFLGSLEGYIKRDGWEYLKFKHAQVSPGFSGSGLVNKETNKICGINRISRNVRDDLGGYAIPIHTIYNLFREVKKYQKSNLIEKLNWYQYIKLQDPIVDFHNICKEKLNQQLRKVGQNKYNKDLYIPRLAENYIHEYINFDRTSSLEVTDIVNNLIQISNSYFLNINTSNIAKIQNYNDNIISLNEIDNCFEILKKDFLYDKVDKAFRLINNILVPNNNITSSEVQDFCSFINNGFKTNFDNTYIKNLLYKARRSAQASERIDTSSYSYEQLIKLLPSIKINKNQKTSNDLIKELRNILIEKNKRCYVIKGKAGIGKTNILCQIANHIIKTNPVLLFSGQMSLSVEYDIEFHIQKVIEEFHNVITADWIKRLHENLLQSNSWFFIIIDGINENKNFELLRKSILEFLTKIEGKRIKLIISCRDIFWELFEFQISSFIFKSPLDLAKFSDIEWINAQEKYFSYYKINGCLSHTAKQSLKTPLLLYFFSFTHQNSEIGEIQDLRILDIFQLYINKINMSFKESLQQVGSYSPVDNFLYKLGKEIIEVKDTRVDIDSLGINYKDATSFDYRLYVFLKSENIIFEEVENNTLFLRFVYDEFLEFIIASTWYKSLDKKNLQGSLSNLLKIIMNEVDSFRPTFGALIFLDSFLKLEESLINKFLLIIEKQFPNWIYERQNFLLNAFEKVTYEKASISLINFAIAFEDVAMLEIKNQLSGIILRFYEYHTNNKKLSFLIKKILGFSDESKIDKNESSANTDTESTLDDKIGLLPPKGFKYNVESKLNAISVLASHGGISEISTISKSIYNLGNIDLHSSLEALQAMDNSTDEVIYAIIDKNLEEIHPEFKIYSAWLLRKKYGIKPAYYFGQLLIDSNTRVHKYVMRVFEDRLVEEELISMILLNFKKLELKKWQIRNYLIILGKYDQIDYEGVDRNKFIDRIINILNFYTYHDSSIVRFEAYNSLLKYSEVYSMTKYVDRMKKEDDIHIQNLLSLL